MAKVVLFTAYDNFALGIRSIASYLEKNGHECSLIFFKNYSIGEIEYPQKTPLNYEYGGFGTFKGTGYDVNPWSDIEENLLYKKLVELNPDIIGLSTRNFLDDKIVRILQRIREKCPRALLVCGGFGPTFTPEVYLQACDYVVVGEGEETMQELADDVDSGNQDIIKTRKNIVYLKDGNIIRNDLRSLLTDFAKIPYPKVCRPGIYHIFDNKIDDTDSLRGVYNIFLGRGCPNKCSYCCAGQLRELYKKSGITAQPYRRRSVDDVISELKKAKEMGFRNISFVDSYLAAPYEVLKELLQRYKEEIQIPVFAHFHPEMALKHPDLIELANECGLHATVVGVQSGSESFAKEVYNRTNSNKVLLDFARLISKYENINIQYHFIFANPLETTQSFEESLCFIKQLADDPDIRVRGIGIHRLNIFPNTPIAEMIKKKGVPEVTVNDWVYQSQMACLRLHTSDETFTKIFNNKEYKNDVNKLITECKTELHRQRTN